MASNNNPTNENYYILAQLLRQQQQQQQQQGNSSILPTSRQPAEHIHLSSLLSSVLQQQGVGVQGVVTSLQPPALFNPRANDANGLQSFQSVMGSINPNIAASVFATALQHGQGVEAHQGDLYQGKNQGISQLSGPQQLQKSNNANLSVPGGLCLSTNEAPPLMQDAVGALSTTNSTDAKNWTLEQLEAHVKHLNDSAQVIPRPIKILLSNARRKQERHNAKKAANRKSASSSRMRKKAQIDAMEQDNIRLKRESLILSFIPDAVATMTINGNYTGDITFANKQLERLLQYKVEDMIDKNIDKFIDASSLKHLRKMIKDLVNAEEQAVHYLEGSESGSDSGTEGNGSNSNSSDGEGNVGVSIANISDPNNSDPNIVSRSSDQSSSMIISESWGDGSEIAKTHKSSSGGKSSEDGCDPPAKKAKVIFDRKEKSAELSEPYNGDAPPSDESKTAIYDVIGEAVTSNNADAKLSSLHRHKTEVKKKSGEGVHNSVDPSSSVDSFVSKTKETHSSDSGYHRDDSNESPDESNESSSSTPRSDDVTKGVQRKHPLAPSCNILLVRSDGKTIWCELTSSIRTSDGILASNTNSVMEGETKELLICFRPIHDPTTRHAMTATRDGDKDKVP